MGQRKFAEARNSTYVAKGMSAALVARVIELAGSAQTEGYMQAYGAMTESNIFDWLAQIDVPALIVAGADDPIARAGDCERVARALPQSEYHCIPNSRALREPGTGGDIQSSGGRLSGADEIIAVKY